LVDLETYDKLKEQDKPSMLVSGAGVEAMGCTNATARSTSWMINFILALISVLAG
jgi:hypothetical protein